MREMRKRLIGGIQKCAMCGTSILYQGFTENNRITHMMEKEHICHDCAFWTDIIAHPTEHMETVAGVCYNIYPEADKKDKRNLLGGKGKLRFFMRPDRSVFRSNDIWTIGTPPERFADKLPNTLIEISNRAFCKMSTNNRKCKARGCLDRYTCWRYDIGLEKDKGPFNMVSKNWKTGDEHCRSYIGFDEILSDW